MQTPRRFTSHVRLVAIYGDTADPRYRRKTIDEVSSGAGGHETLARRDGSRDDPCAPCRPHPRRRTNAPVALPRRGRQARADDPLGGGVRRDARSTGRGRRAADLPRGGRLALRGILQLGDADLPRQDHLRLGGCFTLRGYDRGTLTSRSGYHVGGECFLNRDIVGWLPWGPGRGLGFEAFLAWDHGRILGDPHAPPGGKSGALASVGIGFAGTVGIYGFPRLLVGLHRGLGKRDGQWRLGVEAEREGLEKRFAG